MKVTPNNPLEQWKQAYEIAFTGLKLGTYTFDYHIEEVFFQHFNQVSIQKSDITVDLLFTKKHHFFILDFDLKGTIHAECDRCLVPYPATINQQYRLIVKYEHIGELEAFGDHGKEDIMYITPDTISINVAHPIYESIILGMPMQRIPCEMENTSIVCDQKVLAILEGTDEEEEPDDDDDIDPMWAALKKLKDI